MKVILIDDEPLARDRLRALLDELEGYEIIAEGGPYQDGQNGTVIDETFCLEDGCYFFAIFDEYGDGICCDYGDGSYDLLDADGYAFASSDGVFGSAEFVDFCIENGEIEVFYFKRNQKNAANQTESIAAKGSKQAVKRSASTIRSIKNSLK